jgi:hypothetical protein
MSSRRWLLWSAIPGSLLVVLALWLVLVAAPGASSRSRSPSRAWRASSALDSVDG